MWHDQKLERPQIEEKLDSIERTVLVLPLKKQPIKTADKKQPIKTTQQKEAIIKYAQENGELKSVDLVNILSVGETRVRALLRDLVSEGFLVALGTNRNRVYKLTSYQDKDYR